VNLWEKKLREKFERFAGKIKNIKIFQYKDFLSVKQDDTRTYSLAPKADIENIFLPPFDGSLNKDEENFKENHQNQSTKTPSIGDILQKLQIDVKESTIDKAGL